VSDDIRFALRYARQHGIRPTVASSGHDYEGRSSGRDTLHINMRNFNSISVNMGALRKQDAMFSVTMGPAVKFIELFRMVRISVSLGQTN